MGSEADETSLAGDSSYDNESLDIREINDLEYDIPSVEPPSLESVLWDMESEEGSDSASLHSLQSMTLKFRSMLYHCILQGLSSQVASAGERVGAGLPSAITNSLKFVAIGTSHGYVMAFDSEQKLCWYCHDSATSDQGAISALAFNLDSTRLLVGYERGYISMLDANNGDVLRRLPDAHAPQSAVLHLRFTYLNNLALVGDSSGCVFSLSFSRRLGVRVWDSKCLFSGARGEVCVFEPLVQGQSVHFLHQNILVAMATMSKVIVISIRPKLRVLFSQPLPRVPTSLPLLAWQLVSVGRTFQPVLAWGRGSELNYTRVIMHTQHTNKIRLSTLRTVQLPYTMTALHWLGTRHLAILDTGESLRLVEVRTQKELEVLELASAGLVYSSAHFKALAVGGGVSEAFALAGERACYNSLSSRGEQLLVLGTKDIHMVKLRSWPERLMYLSEQGRWAEALNIAAEEGLHREKVTAVLFNKYLNGLNENVVDRDSLTAAVNCCVKLQKIDFLCGELFDAVSMNQSNLDWFFTLITDHICNGLLTNLHPAVAQPLIDYLAQNDSLYLETVILSLDLACLDLHQVLSICRKRKLYDAWIHVTTKTIRDYTSPLTEFLKDLKPDNHRLGNTMLVYVSWCLAGLGYPNGKIPEEDVLRVKHDILRCLETVHSVNCENEERYPYLRALLKYNIRECLNVVEIAFAGMEFSGEMGLLQRQRLIKILMLIVTPPEFSDSEVTVLSCFISRLVTSNDLSIEQNLLDNVVKSLTEKLDEPLSLRDHTEREQALLDLLNANKLPHLDPEKLLKTALESNCYRVAEHVYNKLGDYSNILTCYLKDPVRKGEVFNYILTYISASERDVKGQFVANFSEILSIDSKKTADIVTEHFPELIEELCNLLDSNADLQYAFLNEIIYSDLKLQPELSERYLELLCVKNKDDVYRFIQLGLCRVDIALRITEKHEVHAATSLLLEQGGEWAEALDMLLNHDMIQEAISLCVRGAEHLDSNGAQQLWLKLLQSRKNCRGDVSLRQLLHAAAPHVPPEQLLELVSDASLGDTKVLLNDMLADNVHDESMLRTALNVLGRDLHHGLAKALCLNGRGTLINTTSCNLCQKSLSSGEPLNGEKAVTIFGCGHCFHSSCIPKLGASMPCPVCRTVCEPFPVMKLSTPAKRTSENDSIRVRPDLEGHF